MKSSLFENDFVGTENHLLMTYQHLSKDVRAGEQALLADALTLVSSSVKVMMSDAALFTVEFFPLTKELTCPGRSSRFLRSWRRIEKIWNLD